MIVDRNLRLIYLATLFRIAFCFFVALTNNSKHKILTKHSKKKKKTPSKKFCQRNLAKADSPPKRKGERKTIKFNKKERPIVFFLFIRWVVLVVRKHECVCIHVL